MDDEDDMVDDDDIDEFDDDVCTCRPLLACVFLLFLAASIAAGIIGLPPSKFEAIDEKERHSRNGEA